MLDKKAKDHLKSLGVDADKLEAAIKDDKEVTIEFGKPDKWVSDEDLASAIDNAKKDAVKSHDISYKEILGKQLNDTHKLGLSTSDSKDLDKVHTAMQAKAVKDAGIAPDEKVKGLERDLETLRGTLTEKDNAVKEWQDKYKEREVNDWYAELVPEKANKFLTKQEHINRLKQIVVPGENGEPINPKTKEPYKDKLAKALDPKKVVEDAYKTNENWLEPEGAGLNNGGGQRRGLGTGGAAGAKSKSMDHDKIVEELASQYDRSTFDGQQKFQEAYTTRILEADKVS